MTTLTVEINKDNDLFALTELIDQLGLNYHVDSDEQLIYTDDVKKELDKRYAEYQQGVVKMISAEESKAEIEALLAANNK